MSLVEEIVVPDRYEALINTTGENISRVIVPIHESLHEIDTAVRRMSTAGRGAFLILRGDSGAGKSTFLHTLKFFKKDVETLSVPPDQNIRGFLQENVLKDKTTVFVLEEREAAIGFSDQELETWLHEINGFLRSPEGKNSLVVWPCNTDPLLKKIEPLARSIGGKALLGPGKGWLNFTGPPKDEFPQIAEKTIAFANRGASIADVGITREQIQTAAENNNMIGDFFSDLHSEIEKARGNVAGLVDQEQCRLWILVIAGNDPGPDVDGLTRGAISAIDTERLMSATEANIVNELKKHPEKVGIVGTVLDAKITHLPVLAASAITRAYAKPTLQTRLRTKGFALKPNKKSDAISRLQQSDFFALLDKGKTGVQPRGAKVGSESIVAFEKLCDIASSADHELNMCIGECLVEAKVISSFEVEKDFGNGLTRRTDLLCQTNEGPIRIEVMWRKKTGRADIANYTLTKVYNYARAIGYI